MSAGTQSSSAPARFAGFVVAVARRFYQDHCLVRASALAYTSLLSMVPLLAVMFAGLKGLGVQGRLEGVLLSRLSLSPEVTDAIIDYVDRVNVGTLGSLGAAMLLLTVISILGGIESSFNHVWRVARSRSLWRKVTDYLSVVLLTPFLLLAGVAITSSMQAERVLNWLMASAYLGGAAMGMLQLAPIGINVAAIGILYAVMPNRRPSPVGVALGALFAGIVWHLVQLAYIRFQIGMANYNAIYGALSQLPITLVWLYVSWAVVLFGAEIAAVYELGWQNPDAALARVDRAALALHLLVRAAERFRDGGGGIDPTRTARDLGVPLEVVNDIVSALQQRRFLLPVEGSRAVVLALDPQRVDLGSLEVLHRDERLPRGCDPKVRQALQRIAGEEQGVWSRWTLADVLEEKRDTTDHTDCTDEKVRNP